MPPVKQVAKDFSATLERMPGNLGWVIVRIPFDSAKFWGKRGQIRVKGDVNGFEFRTCLFPNGNGGHYMTVNNKVQKGAGIGPGIKARFHMELDTTERVAEVPKELERELKQSKALRKYYESMSHSTRHWIYNWIVEAKQAETRSRRGEQMAERLFETMEAERELPPLIRQVMDRTPKAALGWKLMPPSHRRGHLLGIFHYRNPESRIRRIEKSVAMMVEYAEKRAGKIRPGEEEQG